LGTLFNKLKWGCASLFHYSSPFSCTFFLSKSPQPFFDNAFSFIQQALNISYENYGSFRDFLDGERWIISLALAWDITPNTSLNLFGQYVSNRETIDTGIPALGKGVVDIPRDRFLG
jgi:hypothetical protein